MFKKSTFILITFIMLSSIGIWAADLVKVGFVDVQKVLETSSEGKEARKKLDQMVAAREELLKPEKDIIDVLKKELDEHLLMREDLRRQKAVQLQDKMQIFEKKRQRALEEVKIQEQKLTQPILEKTEKIIQKSGVEDGYTIIFEKNYSSLLYAAEQIDLTDTIIRNLDEQYNR